MRVCWLFTAESLVRSYPPLPPGDFLGGRKRERIVLSALSGAEVARLGLVAVVWLGTSYSRARTLTLRGSNPNVALLLYVVFFPSPPIIFITSFPCHHDSPHGDPTSACNHIAHALARTIPTISDESFQPLRLHRLTVLSVVRWRISGSTCYFAYGSNLWMEPMSKRCPTAHYVGLGRLPHHRWMINQRGYANLVETTNPSAVVYGLVYSLTQQDDDRLDLNEGVPWAYTKETMSVQFWASKHGEKVNLDRCPETRQLLVYIDRRRTEDGRPHAEYVHRINMGVGDAVREGVPPTYVDDAIRKFIPAD